MLDAAATVRAAQGRLSGLSVSHRKSVLYGAFVWARRALNKSTSQNGGFRPGQGLGHRAENRVDRAEDRVDAEEKLPPGWRSAISRSG
jgi:hypothetical protein